ncbi:MAG: methyltransferase domain-containing protein [Elusimicrobiota bacterium]|nr:methyltransferase domain-containing protein [Elusimicrobiota bacterium]
MNLLLRTLFKLAGGLSRSGEDAYREDYDLRARTYESAETRPMLKQATKEFISGLGLRPGMRCLDLGCGTGYSSLLLDQAVSPTGLVEGCDNSEAMLREAEKLRAGALSVTRFARAEMLEFLGSRPAGSADFIGSFWAAEYCPLDRLLELVCRALDTGGTAAMLINTHESLSELQRTVMPVLFRNPGYIRCFPPINFPPDMQGFRRSAEKSGLAIERLEECSLEHRFRDASSAISWMRGSGPAAGLTAALKKERLDGFFYDVKKEIESKNGFAVTFRFLKFSGRKK